MGEALRGYPVRVSLIGVVLLALALVLLLAAEGPRLAARVGLDIGARRRAQRRSHLRVVSDESDEFARSVERDLEALPTIDKRD